METGTIYMYLKNIPKVLQDSLKHKKRVITIIGCCVSGMRKSAMINECWTLQRNQRDDVFSILFSTISFLPAGVYSVELEPVFYYSPRPLIDKAPGNDTASLTTCTTCVLSRHKNIIYI